MSTTEDLRRGPGRLSAEAAVALPDRLLDAALALFTERGFAGATMEQVAKAAGASTKTLYSRYAGKEELLAAVVNRQVERVLAEHVGVLERDPRGAEPRAYLESIGLQVIYSIQREGLGLNRLVMSESHRFPQLERFYSMAVARGAAVLREALDQWRAEGLLPLLPETERAATLVQIMMIDRPRLLALLGKPMGDEELIAHVAYAVDTFLRACGYPPRET